MHTILILAAIYGSLVSTNQFTQAPYTIRVGEWTKVTDTATEAEANGAGYKLLIDEPPVAPTNHYAEAVGYTESNRIYRVYEIRENPPAPPRKFSKLKLYGTIAQLGAWAKVQAWLEAKTINNMNGWLAFQLAQEISEDHAMFAALAEEARQLLGLTEEQFEKLLAACVLD